MTWEPGQRAVINRSQIVTIDRVTPSGRAVVGDRTFNPDGYERNGATLRDRLEILTPGVEAEMALVERRNASAAPARAAVDDAERLVRRTFNSWAVRVPDPVDLDRAERLTAAIRAVLEGDDA